VIEVATVELDLAPLVAAFGRRLHDAGVPVTPERSARFAQALTLVKPVARRRLYWTARAALVSDPAQVKAFDAVFAEVFGSRVIEDDEPSEDERRTAVPPDDAPVPGRRAGTVEGGAVPVPGVRPDPDAEQGPDVPLPMAASDEERLRTRRFEELEPAELAQLYRLMARMRVATPTRRTRRAQRERRGEHVDVRRTLRASLRTGGDPVNMAFRRRRIVHRRLVLLCDISGSMEPYSRAYLHVLTAAGAARDAEAFVFATRLTRVTRALAARNPERAIARAAAAAPDWSSGTRIGEALRTFNDRHGRPGMARGAVIVIISDGWERGDPALVGREMERLARLAHRIVWVNPRVSAPGFAPRAGGMAAALPHLDTLVSGHSLDALYEVVEAIGADHVECTVDAAEEEEEPWASATPVAGSSVAMPSGYGPSRGRTTPGW
jgi:uncharacterized protein with von Willebrand factor type A (vWA) domain